MAASVAHKTNAMKNTLAKSGSTVIEFSGWTAEEIAAYMEHRADLEMMDDETEWDESGDHEYSFQEEANRAYFDSRGR